MLHIIRMLERRSPQHAHRFAAALLLTALLIMLAGVGLLAARWT